MSEEMRWTVTTNDGTTYEGPMAKADDTGVAIVHGIATVYVGWAELLSLERA